LQKNPTSTNVHVRVNLKTLASLASHFGSLTKVGSKSSLLRQGLEDYAFALSKAKLVPRITSTAQAVNILEKLGYGALTKGNGNVGEGTQISIEPRPTEPEERTAVPTTDAEQDKLKEYNRRLQETRHGNNNK
jgi:hypothetical protein